MTLEGLSWEKFVIGDLFELLSGRCSNAGNLEHDDMGVPYVGATNRNNGVLDFVKPVDKLMMNGNCIAFVKQGEGSVGYAVYKHEDFIASTSISAGYASFINKYTGIFITTVADKVRGKYNYNYPRSDSRLKQEIIQLPIDESGRPDYAFMERFMRAIESRLIKSYVDHASVRLRNTPPQKLLSFDGVKWKGFRISDVFVISPGKRLRKEDMTAGDKPFIGASDSNNGVTAFVADSNSSEDRNVLGVNYNGSVVESFYHPYTCLFSDDVKRFRLRDHEGDKYIYLFLKTAILQQKIKYTYGYKFNEQRMQNQIIMLPVTPYGSPDWQFMHNFMLAKESQLLLAYLNAKS